MSLWVYLPLVPAISNLLLIALVLRSNWRSTLNRVAVLFLLALALWAFAVFGLRVSPTLEGALTWQRIALGVGPIGAVLYYHFTTLITRPAAPRLSRRLVVIGYLLALAFLILVPTSLLVEGNQMKFYGPAPILGKAFFVYIALLYFFVLMGVVNLWRAARMSPSHQERNRAAYVIVGTACFVIGGLSDFLPVIGLRTYPLGMIGNLLFCLFVTVAIIRHQLLDIRVAIRTGLAYGIVSAVVVGAYVGVIFVFTRLLGTRLVSIWANVAVIFLLAIALQPVLKWVQRMVDRLFYRERLDYLEALGRLTRETQSIADLSGLARTLTEAVALAMQAGDAYLMLSVPQTGEYVVQSSAGGDMPVRGAIPASSAFLAWMARNDGYLRAHDLDILPELKGLRAREREYLEKLGGDIYMPMKTPGGLTGVLVLTPKLSGEPYSNEDTTVLRTLAGQAAMAIENARLFAEEKERTAALRTLEKMKSEFLVEASHQLKTPLTSVKVAADMLAEQEEKQQPSSRSSIIHTLGIGVDSLQKLVNEVLDFAKMQAATLEIHREPSDMAQLIRHVAALMGPALERKKQHLSLELPDSLPPALIDRQRLEQVSINLLENASKFTPKGGNIAVRAHNGHGDDITVEVEDTGPGIPESEQEKIFDPYYQGTDTSKYHPGSGLGLAIAKSLVELHGGKIWLKSDLGQGSTFYFSVPSASTAEVNGPEGVTSAT